MTWEADDGGSGDATSIQGNPVSADTPVPGDDLEWNGAEWTPLNPNRLLNPNDATIGDTLTVVAVDENYSVGAWDGSNLWVSTTDGKLYQFSLDGAGGIASTDSLIDLEAIFDPPSGVGASNVIAATADHIAVHIRAGGDLTDYVAIVEKTTSNVVGAIVFPNGPLASEWITALGMSGDRLYVGGASADPFVARFSIDAVKAMWPARATIADAIATWEPSPARTPQNTMTLVGSFLYVATTGADGAYVNELDRDTLVLQRDLELQGAADAPAYDTKYGFGSLWVTYNDDTFSDGGVARVDVTTMTLEDDIASIGTYLYRLTVGADGVYVGEWSGSDVYFIDPSDNSVVTIATETGNALFDTVGIGDGYDTTAVILQFQNSSDPAEDFPFIAATTHVVTTSKPKTYAWTDTAGVAQRTINQFTQVPVGDTFTATFNSTQGLIDESGLSQATILNVPGGGSYAVEAVISQTQADIRFLGGDARPAAGEVVRESAVMDRDGPDVSIYDTSNVPGFNMPAVAANTAALAYTAAGWESVGQQAQDDAGNVFQIAALNLAGNTVTLRNIGAPDNQAPAAAVAATYLRPANNLAASIYASLFGIPLDPDPRDWVLDATWCMGIYDTGAAGDPDDFVWLPQPRNIIFNASGNAVAYEQIPNQTWTYRDPAANYDFDLPSSAICADGQVVRFKLISNSGVKTITIGVSNAADKLDGTVNGTLAVTIAGSYLSYQLNKTVSGGADWMAV